MTKLVLREQKSPGTHELSNGEKQNFKYVFMCTYKHLAELPSYDKNCGRHLYKYFLKSKAFKLPKGFHILNVCATVINVECPFYKNIIKMVATLPAKPPDFF